MAVVPVAAVPRGCPVAVAPVAASSLRGDGLGIPSADYGEGAAGLSGLVELLSTFLPGIAKVLRPSLTDPLEADVP